MRLGQGLSRPLHTRAAGMHHCRRVWKEIGEAEIRGNVRSEKDGQTECVKRKQEKESVCDAGRSSDVPYPKRFLVMSGG